QQDAVDDGETSELGLVVEGAGGQDQRGEVGGADQGLIVQRPEVTSQPADQSAAADVQRHLLAQRVRRLGVVVEDGGDGGHGGDVSAWEFTRESNDDGGWPGADAGGLPPSTGIFDFSRTALLIIARRREIGYTTRASHHLTR